MQSLPRSTPTLFTSYIEPRQTPNAAIDELVDWVVRDGGATGARDHTTWTKTDASMTALGLGSTGKGILIGMMSAFGSAALVAIILAVIYFFRYTNRGRIFLDRIGRPGEYDDEQAFLAEEEQALEDMDDLQKAEYSRAKGA